MSPGHANIRNLQHTSLCLQAMSWFWCHSLCCAALGDWMTSGGSSHVPCTTYSG
jgi:hypothetical protein